MQIISSKRKKTYLALQLLRAFAFLSVFASHVLIADDVFSRWGVAVFFILSGFLNALHDVDKDDDVSVQNSFFYGIRKVRKIYKLHVIMTFVAILLWGVSNIDKYLADMVKEVMLSILKLATNLLLISDFLPSEGSIGLVFSEYNIVSWYLSASFFFYLLTPLLVKLTKQIKKPVLIAIISYVLTIIIDVLLVTYMGTDRAFWYIYECPLFRLSDYIIGIQVGYLFAVNGDKEIYNTSVDKSRVMLILGIVGSIVLLCLGQVTESPIRWFINSGFYFTIPAVLLIVSLTMINDRIADIIGRVMVLRSLVVLGDLSAYAYLIHVPVINLVHGVYKRFGTVNIYVWCLISLVLTIALSEIARGKICTQKKV